MLGPINIEKTQECGFGDIVHAMFNVLIKWWRNSIRHCFLFCDMVQKWWRNSIWHCFLFCDMMQNDEGIQYDIVFCFVIWCKNDEGIQCDIVFCFVIWCKNDEGIQYNIVFCFVIWCKNVQFVDQMTKEFSITLHWTITETNEVQDTYLTLSSTIKWPL
jgi:hypothetical protein